MQRPSVSRQQQSPQHRQVVRDGQGVFLAHIAFNALQLGAVEQVVERAVGLVGVGVVGKVGQPQLPVDAGGFRVAGDHGVLFPEQVQLAVFRVALAQWHGQAQVLADGQQVEVPADQPRRALAFEFVGQCGDGLHLQAQVTVVGGGRIQLCIDCRQLPAVVERQVVDQQCRPGLELAADKIGIGLGQLQTFCVFDLEAAKGDERAPDAAENVPVGYEVSLPGKGLGAAGVEVYQAFLEQGELVLIPTCLGVVVDFLQQHKVRALVADDPRYLIQAEGHVFTGGAGIRTAAVAQVVPEHIALAGQVLDVPRHHL